MTTAHLRFNKLWGWNKFGKRCLNSGERWNKGFWNYFEQFSHFEMNYLIQRNNDSFENFIIWELCCLKINFRFPIKLSSGYQRVIHYQVNGLWLSFPKFVYRTKKFQQFHKIIFPASAKTFTLKAFLLNHHTSSNALCNFNFWLQLVCEAIHSFITGFDFGSRLRSRFKRNLK